MKRAAVLVISWMLTCPLASRAQSVPAPPPGEEAVDPYDISNANAGATPFAGTDMLQAFNERDGIGRVVDDLVDHLHKDARTADVFRAIDLVRLRRTLKEQFCYILNGGCDYTGRDMASLHRDHGVTTAEFNALVELLQEAMDREGVAFGAQNRLVGKLAPMKRDVVVR